MGLNYLKVSLLSEEDQKSNGTNPRIQLMFVKKHTTQQISTGRGGERLEREESCIFTSFYLRATVTSLHPRPLQFVLDPGKHEAREWTQPSQQQNSYSLINGLTLCSFSHELLL